MNEELQRLRDAVKRANDALLAYVEREYPVGIVVGVRLKHGQTTPTYGVVFSHRGTPDHPIQVEFENARRRYRLVSIDDIMDPKP